MKPTTSMQSSGARLRSESVKPAWASALYAPSLNSTAAPFSAHSEGPAIGATLCSAALNPLARLLSGAATQRSQVPTALRTLITEDNVDLAATYRTLLERRGHHATVAHSRYSPKCQPPQSLQEGFNAHLINPCHQRPRIASE